MDASEYGMITAIVQMIEQKQYSQQQIIEQIQQTSHQPVNTAWLENKVQQLYARHNTTE
ncbi:hypothetical protein [Deminuibacter soli]|uniref:hypothetical protein n=1 Tax=Deminuibacter soli TaxID=2291815 RepID=UPI0013143E59|nr:hypothetical protein [Deminuibacter soli]